MTGKYSLQGEHQRKLYRELLANYNRLERPVSNDSAPLVVELGLTLLQIIDVHRRLNYSCCGISAVSFPYQDTSDMRWCSRGGGGVAFWMCDNKPFILVLTTVPPPTDSLGVSTKTKAGLVWYDTTAVFGDIEVVLGTACVHIVLRGAVICMVRVTHGGHHYLLNAVPDEKNQVLITNAWLQL
ncbi:hypothetical protein NFI96_008071, partial [Prochilodus magdalenae]